MARRKTAKSEPATGKADQRESQRFTLILRAGKLITGQGEYLCVLRDVSTGGVKVRLFHPLVLDQPCQIELSSGERFRLDPAWQDGDLAGLRFIAGPVDVAQLLDETGPFPKRSIRLHLRDPLPITLHSGEPPVYALLEDISQHGAALQCDCRLPIGQSFELADAPLGPIEARVRWRRGARYGVVFQQSFRLDDLARLVARLQQPPSTAQRPDKRAGVNH